MDRETAETVAAEGLAFLAEAPARLRGFLHLSGLEPAELRVRAATPELLSAVLAYLAADESLLLVFAASRNIAPESIGRALAALEAPTA